MFYVGCNVGNYLCKLFLVKSEIRKLAPFSTNATTNVLIFVKNFNS